MNWALRESHQRVNLYYSTLLLTAYWVKDMVEKLAQAQCNTV